MKHKFYTKSGFTIVELLIVIVVIGILAGISIAVYGNAQDRARASVTELDIATFEKGMKLYHTDHSSFPSNLEDMEKSGYFGSIDKMSWGWWADGDDVKRGEYRVDAWNYEGGGSTGVFYWDYSKGHWIYLEIELVNSEWKTYQDSERLRHPGDNGPCRTGVLQQCIPEYSIPLPV